jgi:hypothetical protein
LYHFKELVVTNILVTEHDSIIMRYGTNNMAERDLGRASVRCLANVSQTTALTMLARIRAAGMLTEDAFSSLSPETHGAVELLLRAR